MSPSDHRARAREALRGNWPTAVLVTLAASILGGATYFGPSFSVSMDRLFQSASAELAANPNPLASVIWGMSLPLVVGGTFLAGLISLVIGGAAHVGLCRYHLNLHDRREARFSDLLYAADRFGSVLCMHVLRSLLITAGMILLVVPGIVLAFGLSQAGWILAEDRECGAAEALRRSWQLMCGHKLQLFFLELSFIGWAILAGMILIGPLFLTPYRLAAQASFYRNLIAAERPAVSSGASRGSASSDFSGKTYL